MASGVFKPTANSDDGLVQGGGDFYNQYFAVGKYATLSNESFCRFPSVTIPQGSTITSAFLRFKAAVTRTGTVCINNIYFHASDDAVAPTNILGWNTVNAQKTTAFQSWTAAAWTQNSSYDSVDITAVLQEVVDRSGWVSGNAVMVITNDAGADTGAERYAYVYENGAANVIELHVEWTSAHIITATAGANGSISPSGSVSVTDGDDQTFTITSDATGSAATSFIKDVLVDSVSAGRVASYAFTNVTADHTIAASFLTWPDAEAITVITREIINEPTAALYTDAMLLSWTNEAVRDIAIKIGCIESIVSATTTAGSRLVPVTGHKVRFAEYIPSSGNRVGLQAITPKSLGRLPFNGITPQYWFQWGTDIVIEPGPTAAYSLNLYTATWPDYLMSDLDDEPLVDADFQILILAYVLSKAFIRSKQFATAAACYQLYASSLNKLKARRIKRKKDNSLMLKLPDIVRKIRRKEFQNAMA